MDFGKLYLTTLDFYFRDSRGFGKFIEEYIQQTVDRFDIDYPIEEDLEKTNPEFYYFLIDDISDKWWQFSRDYPSEFRASYISQVFSGIDAHLAKICMLHHNAYYPEKTWKDIKKGSEWSKKSKYLKDYAKVDFKDLQKEWDLLDNFPLINSSC